MPKQPNATALTAAAVAVQPDPEPISENTSADHETIALLAYSYWQARGCPDGSPVEDWLRAEDDLKQRALAQGAG